MSIEFRSKRTLNQFLRSSLILHHVSTLNKKYSNGDPLLMSLLKLRAFTWEYTIHSYLRSIVARYYVFLDKIFLKKAN